MQFFNQPPQAKTKPSLVTIQDYLDGNGVPKLTVQQVISKARVKLLMVKPFWGMLAAATTIELKEVPGMDTAWTDGFSVGFNPKFFGALTLEEFNFILAHEVWHMANLHIPRLGAKDPQIWNVASDHWINLTLHDECGVNTGMSFPDMGRIFPDLEGAGLCMDKKYKDQGADQIYAAIARDLQDKSQQEREKELSSGGLGGDLDYKGFAEANGTQEQKGKELAEYWKGQIASAADNAKKAGKLPGNIARQVDTLLQPEVDWQSMLAQYISFHASDYEFTSPDRRFSGWSFVVPDMVGDKLQCAITIDTSGSISEKMIAKFISESFGIINSFDYVEGTLIGHDHQVHDWHEFTPSEPPPTKLKGGGGTDFHVVFKECEDKEYKPDVMVWFTDLYADFPPKPDFPVLFVIVNSNVKPPEWAADHIYITIPHS